MPVRRWNSRACHSMAAARPRLSRTLGPELRGDTAHGVERAVDALQRRSESLGRLGVPAADARSQPGEVDAEAGEGLAQLVVDLAGDALPLLLAHRLLLRRQGAELLARLLRGVLGVPALGDIVCHRQHAELALDLDEGGGQLR